MVEARGSISAEGRTHISWQLCIENGDSIGLRESRILSRVFPIFSPACFSPYFCVLSETSLRHGVTGILRKELSFRTLDQVNKDYRA
jgi:hypothetical protein